MTLYCKLSRSPKQFLTITGMNLHQFQLLLPKFRQAFEEQEQKRKSVVVKTKEPRRRGAGGGSQFAHELADQMLMLLIILSALLNSGVSHSAVQTSAQKQQFTKHPSHARPL